MKNKKDLFNKIREELTGILHFLEDKPEETIESTLKALWLLAAGFAVSAENALKLSLPDLTEGQIKKLYQMIELRINNTPLAHITNRQNFMGIELISDKRALIPRKETEILGRRALELSKEIARSKDIVHIFDACCGSGNLGIAIAYFNPNCLVYATDISPEAVELTKENISFLNLDQRVWVKQGDLMAAFDKDEYYEKIDLIICNPPYITSSKIQKMEAEISSNEPVLAFDGGMLGINIIQKLISEAPKFLTEEGYLIFEVGAGQGDFIAKLCARAGSNKVIETVTDNSGIIRVILTQKSMNKN